MHLSLQFAGVFLTKPDYWPLKGGTILDQSFRIQTAANTLALGRRPAVPKKGHKPNEA